MSKSRLLAPVVLVALALCAVTASPAFAGTYDAEVETYELTGTNTEEPEGQQTHTFTAGTIPVSCKMVMATAHVTGTKQAASVYTTKSITVVPEYSSCTVAGQNATVDFTTNKCDYLFGEPTGPASPFSLKSITVNCDSGAKVIVITAVTPKCTITVGPQTTAGTSTLTNLGSGSTRDVTLAANVTGIVYTSSGGICGAAGTRSNGTYTGNMTFKAYKDVEHTQQVGFFVTP